MEMSTRSNAAARGVLLRIFGIATLLLFLAMATHAFPLRPPVPAIQFTYSEASFRAVLEQWQPQGIQRFRAHFFIDFPFLASYAIFGYLLAAHLLKSVRSPAGWRRWFPWLLPGAAAMDAVENLLHLYLISGAAAPSFLYTLAGVVATGKWLLAAAFVLGVIRAMTPARARL